MHVLTCLFRTGRTFLGLCAVYKDDCIRPWFASNAGKGQSLAKCLIPPQRRQVYRYDGASVRDEAGASVAGLKAYGFGSWVLNSTIFFRISSTFFFVCSIFLIRPSVAFRGASCNCSSAVAHDFGIRLSNFWTFFHLIPSHLIPLHLIPAFRRWCGRRIGLRYFFHFLRLFSYAVLGL